LTDANSITSTIQGTDAVISFLGSTSLAQRTPEDIFTDAYKRIFAAMREHGVTRIFAMATPSITDPSDKFSLVAAVGVRVIRTIAHSVWKELIAVGKLFDAEASDLQWTILRVGRLLDEESKVVATYVGEGGWNMNTSRPGTADWILGEVEKDGSGEWVKKRPALSNR
jgi:hypothetical protein